MKVRVIEPTINIIPKRLRVAAYVRVSVEKELTEHSFVAQLDHCSKIIKARPDWVNAGVYSDYGITGTKLDRPGFKALMEACNAGKIDLILAKSISRFCRNTVDLLNTIRVLRDKGINVHFERENMDTISDSGELLLSLLASYAQEESRSMSENCKWAIRKKFEQGIGNWFHLYGYRWDGKQFQIIDNEAEVIRRIFKLYTEGVGPHAIAKDLRTHGYVRRDGTPFTYSRIVKILNQEKYCGNSLLQKTFRENHITKRRTVNNGEYPMYFIEESHPAIINPKMYEKVKEVMAMRREQDYKAGRPARFSCFTGKIICANCGHTFIRTSKEKKWPRYIWKCGTKKSHGAETCKAQNMHEKLLEMAFCSVSYTKIFNPSLFAELVDHVVVQSPYTLVFHFKDKSSVTSCWEYNITTKQYTEVTDGKVNNHNTRNT